MLLKERVFSKEKTHLLLNEVQGLFLFSSKQDLSWVAHSKANPDLDVSVSWSPLYAIKQEYNLRL